MAKNEAQYKKLKEEIIQREIELEENIDEFKTLDGALTSYGSSHALGLRRQASLPRKVHIMQEALRDIDSGRASKEMIIPYWVPGKAPSRRDR